MPSVGEAAEELFRQQELWPSRPDPESTGLDLFGEVIAQVDAANHDSDRVDLPLLHSVYRFGAALDGAFAELRLPSGRLAGIESVLDRAIKTARELWSETPTPRRVRVVGRLDMIRQSGNTFALRTASEEEVQGVLSAGPVADLAGLFGWAVLVAGRAVYRPFGRLLRIDAEEVTAADGEQQIWSHVPGPLRKMIDRKRLLQPQTRTTGVAAFLGKWPGNETEEELLEALHRLR
jgi:hypothetical protein